MCISYISKSFFTVIESENNRYGLFMKNIGSIKIKKLFKVLGIHILKKIFSYFIGRKFINARPLTLSHYRT